MGKPRPRSQQQQTHQLRLRTRMPSPHGRDSARGSSRGARVLRTVGGSEGANLIPSSSDRPLAWGGPDPEPPADCPPVTFPECKHQPHGSLIPGSPSFLTRKNDSNPPTTEQPRERTRRTSTAVSLDGQHRRAVSLWPPRLASSPTFHPGLLSPLAVSRALGPV